MIVKTLKRAGVGFLLGIVIGNLIALLTGGGHSETFIPVSPLLIEKVGDIAIAELVQSLVSGAYGAICFAGVSFYEVEKLPLSLAMIFHCALVILTYIPCAVSLDWVSDIKTLLIVILIQLIVYFIIWLIMYSIYKSQVKELNALNQKKHNKDD